MKLEEWEEFWAYLVKDMSIVERMGTNHLDSVGEFLEWKRQEWIKYHDNWPTDDEEVKSIKEYIREKAKHLHTEWGDSETNAPNWKSELPAKREDDAS